MDRFQAITAFARVVELGSFARAAERLSVSTSAVSRQVAELEAHLDARLLNRTTRRLSLTEAGQAYYERSVQLLADLDDAESLVRTATVVPKGRLRLTCGITFGVRYLAPAIAEFGARHPQLTFDLDLSDRTTDLVEEGFDLAVRIGTAGPPGLVARRLGHTQLICCASPSYLEAHGEPRHPDDLLRHKCLEYTYAGGKRMDIRGPRGTPSSGPASSSVRATAACSPRWPSRTRHVPAHYRGTGDPRRSPAAVAAAIRAAAHADRGRIRAASPIAQGARS
jgi:DNA-binding transcriptional LysR family regulator